MRGLGTSGRSGESLITAPHNYQTTKGRPTLLDLFYTCRAAPGNNGQEGGDTLRYTGDGVQDAARPRRGPSPPERSNYQGSYEPPFRPLQRTPGMTTKEVRYAEAVSGSSLSRPPQPRTTEASSQGFAARLPRGRCRSRSRGPQASFRKSRQAS